MGPDNGLLPWAMDTCGGAGPRSGVAPPAGRDEAGTFNGRDVFAPAGPPGRGRRSVTWATTSIPPASSGSSCPPPAAGEGSLAAEVQWVDGFGNVQLAGGHADASAAATGAELDVEAGAVRPVDRALRVRAFAALEPGRSG